eukprot:3391737-Prymnesium_polylepis.1
MSSDTAVSPTGDKDDDDDDSPRASVRPSRMSQRASFGPRGEQSQGLASKKWARVKKATVVRAALTNELAEVRAERGAHSALPQGVVTRCSRAESLERTPYWMQGDEAMYSVEALEHRYALRNDPKVLQALQVWWEAALRSVRADTSIEAAKRLDVVCPPRRPQPKTLRTKTNKKWLAAAEGTTPVMCVDARESNQLHPRPRPRGGRTTRGTSTCRASSSRRCSSISTRTRRRARRRRTGRTTARARRA